VQRNNGHSGARTEDAAVFRLLFVLLSVFSALRRPTPPPPNALKHVRFRPPRELPAEKLDSGGLPTDKNNPFAREIREWAGERNRSGSCIESQRTAWIGRPSYIHLKCESRGHYGCLVRRWGVLWGSSQGMCQENLFRVRLTLLSHWLSRRNT